MSKSTNGMEVLRNFLNLNGLTVYIERQTNMFSLFAGGMTPE